MGIGLVAITARGLPIPAFRFSISDLLVCWSAGPKGTYRLEFLSNSARCRYQTPPSASAWKRMETASAALRGAPLPHVRQAAVLLWQPADLDIRRGQHDVAPGQ
jgi:hypothetical protein